MICLGIESTAHTFSVGIVENEKVLANEKSMYIPKKGFGIIPKEAALHHSEVSSQLLNDALKNSNVKIDDVDLIAFSQGPGLPQCLRIGAVVARTLSLNYKKPT